MDGINNNNIFDLIKTPPIQRTSESTPVRSVSIDKEANQNLNFSEYGYAYKDSPRLISAILSGEKNVDVNQYKINGTAIGNLINVYV